MALEVNVEGFLSSDFQRAIVTQTDAQTAQIATKKNTTIEK